MKITLRLTDNQIFLLDDLTEGEFRGLYEDEMHTLFSSNRSNVKLSQNEILVQDIDKFRKFLNVEMVLSDRFVFDILKSILSKLDKAVQNDCDNCDSSGYIPEDKEGGNKECPECSDEPKCTKCGSKFEDEYWKTDGLEYEQYRCSNEDCQAVHQINIDRNDEEGGEVDIDRDWDTLEFVEFYICPASIKQIEETIEDKPKVLEIKTSWSVNDVRTMLRGKVEHMTDDEIFDSLSDLTKQFEMGSVDIGWDIINDSFSIKPKK
tara:strand:+ start:697 stop:1485 length:789 start_codon:yes stop_codon:yes gene_type:complete